MKNLFPDKQGYTSVDIATFVPIYIYKRGWLRDILIYPSIRSVGGSLWAEIELFLKINVTRAACGQHVRDVTIRSFNVALRLLSEYLILMDYRESRKKKTDL